MNELLNASNERNKKIINNNPSIHPSIHQLMNAPHAANTAAAFAQ
jgi:hypothetical protein